MRVLVVEADSAVSHSLVQGLTRHGYDARAVGTGREAAQAHEESDMVVLTLELPDLDGVELCRGIRAGSNVPIIALTSGTDEIDRVLSLQAGADDCMGKPYGLRELLARMESVLRRARPPEFGSISHGPLRIDRRRRHVAVGDQSIQVTRKEFDLLYVLVSHPGVVVSRKELMAKVWEDDWAASDRTIDTHVSSLRSKLGGRNWIVAVRGVGYRIGHEPDWTSSCPGAS